MTTNQIIELSFNIWTFILIYLYISLIFLLGSYLTTFKDLKKLTINEFNKYNNIVYVISFSLIMWYIFGFMLFL